MTELIPNAYYKLITKPNRQPVSSFWCYYHYEDSLYKYIKEDSKLYDSSQWFMCSECGKIIAPHNTIFDLVPVSSIRLPQTKHS